MDFCGIPVARMAVNRHEKHPCKQAKGINMLNSGHEHSDCARFSQGLLTAQRRHRTYSELWPIVFPMQMLRVLPISDGGEGALEIWSELGLGRAVQVSASDPLGRPIRLVF